MSKTKNSSKAINWITGAAAAYFIGSAIAGAIKRKRKNTNGIGATKRTPRRIWAEVEEAQRNGIDLTNPDGWTTKTDVLARMAHGKIKSGNSDKPDEQRYFNQLRRAYKSIAGTNLPYKESIVRNENGDVILMYRDYGLENLAQTAAYWMIGEAEMDADTQRAAYWSTIAEIATGSLKFVWASKGVHRGVEQLIFGQSAPEERKKRISYLASPAKGGVYPEQLAHDAWESDETGRRDTQDILDGILEAIRTCTSVGQAQQMCKEEYLKAHQIEEPLLYNDVPF